MAEIAMPTWRPVTCGRSMLRPGAYVGPPHPLPGEGSAYRAYRLAGAAGGLAAVASRRGLRRCRGEAETLETEALETEAWEAWEARPEVWVVALTALLVPLLGMLTSGDGLVLEVDGSIHELARASGDRGLFNEASNRLDDLGQLVAWLVAALAASTCQDAALLLTVPGGLQVVRLLQRGFKDYFHRIRPSDISDFSYPSAHTARFVFCAGLVLCVLMPRLLERPKTPSSPSVDQWAAAGCGAWLAMGSCRVLADAHWPSDTFGGALLGLEVAALAQLALGLWEAPKEKMGVRKGSPSQNP